jgi:membrane associated rhomboid family serine protease
MGAARDLARRPGDSDTGTAMGIYDREYYRRDGPSFLGSLGGGRSMCVWLIGINVACFLLQYLTITKTPTLLGSDPEEPFTSALDLSIPLVLHGQVWRLLTYAFLHSTGNIWHIAMNMLFLYWFGRQVEEQLGRWEFLAFYLAGVVAAALAYVGAGLLGLMPPNFPAVGASGGVMAVLVLAAFYYPRQTIYLFFVIPVPIWAFAVGLVAIDLFTLLSDRHSQVATAAHLGGAAFGFAYYRLGWRLTLLWPSLSTWTRRATRPRPRLRLYDEDEEPTPSPVPAARPAPPPPLLEDEQLEAQVDAILAKIHRDGKDKLTEHEREVLVRASEAIKRRRS